MSKFKKLSALLFVGLLGSCASGPEVDPEKYDIRCVKERCEATYASCVSDNTTIGGFSTETMILCKQRYQDCIKGCSKVPKLD